MPISKDLLAKIVDEVFGGSIEDTQVIEDIHSEWEMEPGTEA